MKILLTSIGKSDSDPDKRFGPILRILIQREFDKLYLFYDKEEFHKIACQMLLYCRDEYDNLDVNYQPIIVDDPTDYNTIYPAMYSAIKSVLEENENENPKYTISLTSGTPTMHSCWFCLERGGSINAELIQISRDSVISEVTLKLDDFPHIKDVDAVKAKLTQISREKKAIESKLRLKGYEILGDSNPIQELREHIQKGASTNAIILITGEPGTGKELVARNIHSHSNRCEGRFVAINCSAIVSTLIESELFGHEKGAFTGALEMHIGKFEYANHGTIFLDEIGNMPLEAQSKLLRVLEEKVLQRVGGNDDIEINVRVIAATNKNLQAEIKEKKFRSDLFDRLNVCNIECPVLRYLQDDIPLIAEHYLNNFLEENKKSIPSPIFEKSAIDKLKSHTWPGNVRELRNTMERSAINYKGNKPLDESDVYILTKTDEIGTVKTATSLEDISEQAECKAVLESLNRHNWVKKNVIEELKTNYVTLNKIIKRCNINK